MMLNDPHPCIVISSDCEESLSFEALRDSRFSHMCRAPLCIPHLSFIPLEPYPARYARHLPHAGKALSVVILFSHMRVFVLTLWGKRYSRIVAFPLEGKAFDAGGAVFSFCNLYHSRLRDSRFPHMCLALLRFPHLSFMLLEPYPAGDTRETRHPQTFGHRPYIFAAKPPPQP